MLTGWNGRVVRLSHSLLVAKTFLELRANEKLQILVLQDKKNKKTEEASDILKQREREGKKKDQRKTNALSCLAK